MRFLRFAAVLLFCLAELLPADARQRTVPIDTAIVSTDFVTVKGQRIPYRVTLGFQPVYGEEDTVIASLQYTFYERTDDGDNVARPLVISFNGGPGSASVWMHLGYTGPRNLLLDDEGFPIQPYGVRENPNSIIDVADIVYVNPVNTGFSRMVGDADPEKFFGVNEDIAYLADWIDTFVSRNGRWPSPKILIGESYGTTRVSGLAGALQNGHWMYLNGVILVSPTGLGVDRDGPVGAALRLPYFAAAAWYHDALAPALQGRDLEELLPDVEEYTLDTYLPALARGGSLSPEKRAEIAERIAYFSGLQPQVILDHNLRVSTSFFWKELLRTKGLTIGRLDSRYRGQDRSNAGEQYDFDPALSSWNHEFAPAINNYLRDILGFKTDLKYNVFGPVSPWNREGDRTGENLRQAMAQNPFLHLMVQSGYYDGATDYFNARYTMWNMDPGGRLQDRMVFHGYRSGHMMYLRRDDLARANDDIRAFIRTAVDAGQVPARR